MLVAIGAEASQTFTPLGNVMLDIRTSGDLRNMDASVVARLLEQTARAVYESRGPRAIHPGQWAVLRYLARAGRQARTVGGVAVYLGVTHAPASRAVAALARKDLVTVKADAEDRRVRRIDLTAAGRSLLDHDPVHRLSNAIEALPAERQREFAKTLETVYGKLAKV
jgi:DNA-binding MarR family transcriptional regulator